MNTHFSLMWLKRIWTLFWIWFTEQFSYDSKNWTFLEKVTLRIYCFWKLLNFSLNIDSKNKPLIFWTMSQRLGPFLNVTQRIPCVKYDSNGTFFFHIWHKELTFWVWIKELDSFFFEHDAKNWTLHFLNMTPRIGPLFKIWLKKIELFECDSKIFAQRL